VWNKLDRPLVLASSSPRRKDILGRMGLTFEVREPAVESEQAVLATTAFSLAVADLALAKARSVEWETPESLVLSGDTIVCLGNKLMGKPAGRDEARRMLRDLSGKAHTVHTGVALVCAECRFAEKTAASTTVHFRHISADEIEAYLTGDEYADKAGAYAIQGAALTFVDKIDGCFYNVVGLPVAETIRLFTLYERRKEKAHV
jgi:septum formation protein